MKQTLWIVLALLLLTTFVVACESGDGIRGSGADGDSDGDGDGDSDPDGPPGEIHGVVLSPSGDVPISGALVYVTSYNGPQIEDHVFCYECEDMTSFSWTLSEADGSWSIEDVPSGDWNLVTRKGFFQRQRAISVVADANTEIPQEYTTLPAENSDDGLDQIPNYAVLLTSPDLSHYLLAKFGMYNGDFSGSFSYGLETFDIYNNTESQGSYGLTIDLFSSVETLEHYHMIFLPCSSTSTGLSFVDNNAGMLQNYVSHGGKIYNSCTVGYWTETPFPEYIEFYGDDNVSAWDVGRRFSTATSTNGTIADQELRDWLGAVLPTQNLDAFPFQNGYSLVDALNTVEGHGLEEDNFVVTPYTWVYGAGGDDWNGLPLMMTYNYDCGKVFYSIYETTSTGSTLTPQEYVLLYITLEVGVCEGDYIIE